MQRNSKISELQQAYKWAAGEAKNYRNKAELARDASAKFNVSVVPQTLRKLLCEGRDQVQPPGPKPSMEKETFDMVCAAMCSFIAIGQINGDAEKKTSDLLAHLEHLLKGKKFMRQKLCFIKLKNNVPTF